MSNALFEQAHDTVKNEFFSYREEALKVKTCPCRHNCPRYEKVMSEFYNPLPDPAFDTCDEFDSDEEDGVCAVCDMYDQRKAKVEAGEQTSFLIVAYGVSRHYGGPEEGGWWYDWTAILEVRVAYTLIGGLRHARELREKYSQPKYDRYSCSNNGEADIYIRTYHSENDPRFPKESVERPRYE